MTDKEKNTILRKEHDRIVRQGHAVYAKHGTDPGIRVKALDPHADIHLFMPPLQGG